MLSAVRHINQSRHGHHTYRYRGLGKKMRHAYSVHEKGNHAVLSEHGGGEIIFLLEGMRSILV